MTHRRGGRVEGWKKNINRGWIFNSEIATVLDNMTLYPKCHFFSIGRGLWRASRRKILVGKKLMVHLLGKRRVRPHEPKRQQLRSSNCRNLRSIEEVSFSLYVEQLTSEIPFSFEVTKLYSSASLFMCRWRRPKFVITRSRVWTMDEQSGFNFHTLSTNVVQLSHVLLPPLM